MGLRPQLISTIPSVVYSGVGTTPLRSRGNKDWLGACGTGNVCIWKRNHVNLMAILQLWQQPTLSCSRCCRRHSRDGKKQSPVTAMINEHSIPEAGFAFDFSSYVRQQSLFIIEVTLSWVFCYGESEASWEMQVRTMFIFVTATSQTPVTAHNSKWTTKVHFWVNQWTSVVHSCFPSRT